MTLPDDDVPCKTHPRAPHGFCRQASHANHRYVCECEGWEPPLGGTEAAFLAEFLADKHREYSFQDNCDWSLPTADLIFKWINDFRETNT